MTRWLNPVETYDFETQYRMCTKHVNADVISLLRCLKCLNEDCPNYNCTESRNLSSLKRFSNSVDFGIIDYPLENSENSLVANWLSIWSQVELHEMLASIGPVL